MTHDPDEAVVLAVLGSEMEAEILADALRARGIEAQTSGGLTAGFRAEAPGGAKVLIHRRDQARATEAITEIRADAAGIDWDQVDVGEVADES